MTHEQFKDTIYKLGSAISMGLWVVPMIHVIDEFAIYDGWKVFLLVLGLFASLGVSWIGVGLSIAVMFYH